MIDNLDSKNEFTREIFVKIVPLMPDLTMQFWHGIYLEGSNKDERKAIGMIRETYRCTALWHEFYLLEKKITDELTQKPLIYYKPFAERDLAILRLAQEVYIRSSWVREHTSSPLFWMFRIKLEICENELQNSWFGGRSQRFSKSLMYKQAIDNCDSLLYVHRFIRSEPEVYSGKDYGKLLVDTGILIAQEDRYFRDTYWQPFLEEQKRFYRSIKSTPHMSVLAVEDGNVRIVGNGKRGKDTTKRKPRGFR